MDAASVDFAASGFLAKAQSRKGTQKACMSFSKSAFSRPRIVAYDQVRARSKIPLRNFAALRLCEILPRFRPSKLPLPPTEGALN